MNEITEEQIAELKKYKGVYNFRDAVADVGEDLLYTLELRNAEIVELKRVQKCTKIFHTGSNDLHTSASIEVIKIISEMDYKTAVLDKVVENLMDYLTRDGCNTCAFAPSTGACVGRVGEWERTKCFKYLLDKIIIRADEEIQKGVKA